MLDTGTVRSVLEWAAENEVPTPAFLFAPAVVTAAIARLREELGGRISYAVKSNAHPSLVQQVAPLVDAFNVTNVSHVDLLLSSGVDADRIAFIHPVVQPRVIKAVIERGVRRFVVDDLRGVRLLGAAGVAVSVSIRFLPPGVRESEFSYARFGAALEGVPALALEATRAGLLVEGLSFFLGGSVDAPEPFIAGIRAAAEARRVLVGVGVDIGAVNIGGGFLGSRSAVYRDRPTFFRDIAMAFREQLGAEVTAWTEPGRFVCQGAVALLSEVIACRTVGTRRVAYLDASAYGGLIDCFVHRGQPLALLSASEGDQATCDVTGPVMDSHDLIKPGASLPRLEEGAGLLVPNIGAYTWGMATTCEGLEPPAFIEMPKPIQDAFALAWYSAQEEVVDPCAS